MSIHAAFNHFESLHITHYPTLAAPQPMPRASRTITQVEAGVGLRPLTSASIELTDKFGVVDKC